MKMENQAWKGFHGGEWQRSIDVRSFIQKNWTPYEGDGSFLTGPTQRTRAVWERCEDLLRQELRKGVLDVETHIVSGIDSFAPGYIDRENEVIVGLQTDAPLKRIVNLYGGTRMARSALEQYGYRLDPEIEDHFSQYRKTHNEGVFDAYPERTRKARHAGLLTGLPDAYGRGRIIGDYRRVALYGIDRLVEEKRRDLDALDGPMDEERIRLREEVSEQIRALEEKYARLECPIVSNNSAHRWTDDVPMVVPEINADHLAVIEAQRKRLGTRRGFIAVKSNCSLQSYVPALHPLKKYGLDKILVCTYQAISGAGKTFQRWPEMVDNCIPYIGGEEEKSEQEPLKLWGRVEDGKIVRADGPSITAQCFRVACQDGHMAAVFMKFADGKAPSMEQIKADWAAFRGVPQELELPSAPKQFLHYFEEPDRPQTRLDRNLEHGMAVSVGRLRPDTQYDYKFVCLSHNTLRGAAGGAVLLAELLCAKGYMD